MRGTRIPSRCPIGSRSWRSRDARQKEDRVTDRNIRVRASDLRTIRTGRRPRDKELRLVHIDDQPHEHWMGSGLAVFFDRRTDTTVGAEYGDGGLACCDIVWLEEEEI